MEIKTQIIVAVFTSLAGFLLGIFMVVFAVCYRRRSLKANHGHNYYHDNREEADDRGSMYFGQRRSQNHKNNSSSSSDRISNHYERENLNEVELRPKLHQAKWNKSSNRMDRRTSDKRHSSNNKTDDRMYVDFRTSIHIPRPHTWSDHKGKNLTHFNKRRNSDSAEMRQIPRPNVRPYKSELYGDNENTYDYINLMDHHTVDMASHRSSRNLEFY